MKSPKCRLCGENHWGNCSFPKNVATPVKNVATIPNVATENVATIRRVSIRELNAGISSQFSDLPFEVTRNGKVIARVVESE